MIKKMTKYDDKNKKKIFNHKLKYIIIICLNKIYYL